MAAVRFGTHPVLEAEADRLLKESLKGVNKHSAKADILTPWKDMDRRKREVYVAAGVPDPALRQGSYHRRGNPARPDLDSREGIAAAGMLSREDAASRALGSSSLADHVAQQNPFSSVWD